MKTKCLSVNYVHVNASTSCTNINYAINDYAFYMKQHLDCNKCINNT